MLLLYSTTIVSLLMLTRTGRHKNWSPLTSSHIQQPSSTVSKFATNSEKFLLLWYCVQMSRKRSIVILFLQVSWSLKLPLFGIYVCWSNLLRWGCRHLCQELFALLLVTLHLFKHFSLSLELQYGVTLHLHRNFMPLVLISQKCTACGILGWKEQRLFIFLGWPWYQVREMCFGHLQSAFCIDWDSPFVLLKWKTC